MYGEFEGGQCVYGLFNSIKRVYDEFDCSL